MYPEHSRNVVRVVSFKKLQFSARLAIGAFVSVKYWYSVYEYRHDQKCSKPACSPRTSSKCFLPGSNGTIGENDSSKSGDEFTAAGCSTITTRAFAQFCWWKNISFQKIAVFSIRNVQSWLRTLWLLYVHKSQEGP